MPREGLKSENFFFKEFLSNVLRRKVSQELLRVSLDSPSKLCKGLYLQMIVSTFFYLFINHLYQKAFQRKKFSIH